MDIERAARLQALLAHPVWPELVATITEKKDKYFGGVLSGLIATGELPDNFEYKRGFIAGMEAVIRQPDVATNVLDRETKKQRDREEQRVA